MKTIAALALTLFATLPVASFAQSTSQNEPSQGSKRDAHDSGRVGQPHEPPPEAFAACTGKKQGDVVSVKLPDGKVLAATCEKFPGDGRLAARPKDMPKGGPHGRERRPGGEEETPPASR